MSKLKIIIAVPVLSVVLLAMGCAREQKPAEIPGQPQLPVSASKAPEKSAAGGWQQEWEKSLAEAKKESNLVLLLGAGIPTSTRQELAKEMKSRFGVTTEIIAGQGGQLAAKIIQEAKAGLDRSDVYISGSSTITLSIKPEGLLQSIEPLLILPDVKDPRSWFEGKLPFMDKEGMVMGFSAYIQQGLSYNSTYVSKEELQSYRDLLAPKFKGKIVMNDPTIPGAGSAWASTIGIRVMGTDWLKEFVKQDITITRDLRLLVDMLARGKSYIAIGAGGLLGEVQQAGVPVYEYSPREGGFLTTGWGTMAVFKKLAHPAATRVFLNWFLGKEGQAIFARGVDQQSARLDVPTDFLNPAGLRQSGLKSFDARSEQFDIERSKDSPAIREIFNPR